MGRAVVTLAALVLALLAVLPVNARAESLPLDTWVLKPQDIGPAATELSRKPFDARDMYPDGEGTLFEVRRANVVGGLLVRFAVSDLIGLNIHLVEHRNHDWASPSSQLKGVAVDPGLPPDTYLSSLQHFGDGKRSVQGEVAVGRTRVWVTVYERELSSTVTDDELTALRLSLLRKQIEAVVPAPDLPVTDDSPVAKVGRDLGYQLAFFSVVMLLAAVLAGSAAATLRDRGSREVFASLFKRSARQQRWTDIGPALRRVSRRRLRASVVRITVICALVAVCIGMPGLSLWLGLFLLVGAMVVLQLLGAARRGGSSLPSSRTTVVLGFLGGAGSLATMAAGFFFVVAAVSGQLFVHSLEPLLITGPMALFGVFFLSSGRQAIRFARRLAQPEVRRLIQGDQRRPVLLLRSFQDDSLEVRVHAENEATPVERLNIESFARFEEVVAWALWKHGPIRAIGQPGTRLQPLGAVRDYYSDDQWQPAVREYIDESALIVFVVGRSPGLLWEVENVRAHGALAKCVFILPPVPLEEIEPRVEVLAGALGLDHDRLRWDSGTYPLVLVFDEHGVPRLVVGPGRDDRAYALALALATTGISARPGELGDAHPDWRGTPRRPVGDLLVRFDPARATRPRKSFVSRLLDAILILTP
jgi:hypothetical protein